MQPERSSNRDLSHRWTVVLFIFGVGFNLFLAAWAARWLLHG
jgi:hypothetical protein